MLIGGWVAGCSRCLGSGRGGCRKSVLNLGFGGWSGLCPELVFKVLLFSSFSGPSTVVLLATKSETVNSRSPGAEEAAALAAPSGLSTWTFSPLTVTFLPLAVGTVWPL